MNSGIVIAGTIAKLFLEAMSVMSHECRGISHCGSSKHFYICIYTKKKKTLIQKTNLSDSLRRIDSWRRVHRTMAPFGLNIEDHF